MFRRVRQLVKAGWRPTEPKMRIPDRRERWGTTLCCGIGEHMLKVACRAIWNRFCPKPRGPMHRR